MTRYWLNTILTATAAAMTMVPGERCPGAEDPDQIVFRAVDTSRLMGSPDPMPLEAERVFPNLSFNRPLEFTYAPDGSNRVFVVEQEGKIHVFANDPGVKETKIFLDITEVVSRDGNEEGLLGLAFHPDYRENGEFFVYYSTRPRASIVSRFRVSPDDPEWADRGSEERLLRIEQPFGNHNGGSIRFGPDGYLYIGLGDGGSAHDPLGHGQNLETLLGSILRIDVDRRDEGKKYAVPEDNPFVLMGDRARGEIWAYGLRNVWRLAFDRATGDLWAGDVGQNRYEEVDLIKRGGNYGWNIREGFHPFHPDDRKNPGPLIDPLAEYYHSEGLSITGGLVYRGERLPEYVGAYFYADYVSGQVWILRQEDGTVTENRKVARTGLPITAFGEDAQGEMVFTAFDGHLYRFRKRDIDVDAVRRAFPKKLSETGMFQSVRDLHPAAGLIPYEVNVPLWSDGASKQRFIALPAKRKVGFHERAAWEFPVGTVLVKTFFLELDRRRPTELRRLETRLFVHAPNGWHGYTYVWNEDRTEAELLEGALTRTYQIRTADGVTEQSWYFPSGADCMACHTKSAGFVLGPNTRQFNRTHDYGGFQANQIETLDHVGVFSGRLPKPVTELEAYPEWNASSKPLDASVRAYLDVNCANCHNPAGIAGSRPDLRWHAPLKQMGLIGMPAGQGRLGPSDSLLVTPGDPKRSELLLRMSTRGSRQMPPLATNMVDRTAVELIERWIAQWGWQAENRRQ